MTEANKLPLLRMKRIAPDTLLCLFAGDLQTMDIHEKPEVIHFGLSYESGQGAAGKPCYYKVLRDDSGDEFDVDPETIDVSQNDPNLWNSDPQVKVRWVPVPFSHADSGTINIANLQKAIYAARHKGQTATNGDMPPNIFAFEMAEGVQKVRFVRSR